MSSRARIIEAAEEHVRAGRFGEAVAEYGRLLDGGVNDVPVNTIIGDLKLKLGRRGEALRIFRTNMAVLDERGAFAQALAVAKKLHKLDPGDGEIRERMGDLYGRLGFAAEARAEYLEAAGLFQERKDVHGRISAYGKLSRLDRTDFATRLKLARLLSHERRAEPALAEFNAIADIQAARGDDAGAEKALREALALDPADVRTVAGLLRGFRRRGRLDLAFELLEAVPDGKTRPEFLLLLGELSAESGDAAKARECFERILVRDPDHAEARVHLGRLEVRAGRTDLAFAALEPLVTQALHKSRDDRAIGLLGLILMSGPLHLPSLEKLAHVYRLTGRKTELEITDRLLLREYRAQGLDADRERVLGEIASLAPRDRSVAAERKTLSRDLPKREPDDDAPALGPALGPADRDLIQANLAKADHYIEQGLVRNARRILENLAMLFPGEPRIESRLEAVRSQERATDEVDIPGMLRRILSLESETAEESADEAPTASPSSPPPHAKTVSLDEIFGGADLTATAPPPGALRPADYPDLSDKIREEREAMDLAFYGQLRARTGPVERDLAEIVADFRKRVEQRIAHESRDVRYNLGLAFMEQGLLDEAVEELKLAIEEPGLSLDGMALIGQCFRQKREFATAAAWVEKALRLAPPGSGAELALTYDLAQLREDGNQTAAALGLYRQVEERSPRYRDTALRIKVLEGIAG